VFLGPMHAWHAAGSTIERVLSDNGSCYRSKTWAATCSDLGIIPKPTRPCWAQANGKPSGSTAPWLTNGPTPARTPPNRTPCRP
jgi:hypothetical protein